MQNKTRTCSLWEQSQANVFTQNLTTWTTAHSTRQNKKATKQKITQPNMNRVLNKTTHTDRRAHAPTARQNMERKCPRVWTLTRSQNGTWTRHECWDLNTTLQHKTRHTDMRARTQGQDNTGVSGQGSVTKPRINKTEVTEPWHSHSDGTHSLQRIHWWASDGMLHFSQSVTKKKSTFWMAWRSVNVFFECTFPLRLTWRILQFWNYFF